MTLALGALASPALAGETTVTLAVRNWYCAACPHIIKQSLAAVPGAINATVSDKTKTASACCGAPVRPGRDRLHRSTKAARGQALPAAIN
jgi:periplasmic mercuric ion binding protein